MAGALGLRLCGPASYFGVVHDKPFIGDDTRPIIPRDIDRACRLELAGSLNAVVSQQLLPCLQGGRVLAAEVMMMNAGIRTLMRDNKTHQIDNAIATGSADGSITMDNSLILLYQQGKISRHDCVAAARDPEYVKKNILTPGAARLG